MKTHGVLHVGCCLSGEKTVRLPRTQGVQAATKLYLKTLDLGGIVKVFVSNLLKSTP